MSKMLDWQPTDSSWVVAEAYDAEAECIFVRLDDGTEWCYEACPLDVWEAFTAPGQSRGQFINQVLKLKPGHRSL
jgi:predicted lipoprotein with Yx(FWY)xxD motif